MPTDYIKTIKPDGGGDYTSLAAWQVAEAQNLVTNDRVAIADCYGSTGDVGVGSIYATGWTTDITRRIIIRAAAGQRHIGVFDPLKAKMTTGLTTATCWAQVTPSASYHVWIDGMQMKHGSPGYATDGYAVYLGGQSNSIVWVSNCIIDGNQKGGHGIIKDYGSTNCTYYIWNNIIYDIGSGVPGQGYRGIILGFGTSYVYNNIVAHCNTNFCVFSSGLMTCKNNISIDHRDGGFSPDSWYQAVGTYTGNEYNQSNGNPSLIGTNSRINVNPSFMNYNPSDYSKRDFRLAANDTAVIGYGKDLSSDPNLFFNTDNIGNLRPAGQWDIGAYEYTVQGLMGVKTWNGLSYSNIKTLNGLERANIKSILGNT